MAFYTEDTAGDKLYKWAYSLLVVMVILFVLNVCYSLLSLTLLNWIQPFQSLGNAVCALLQIALLTCLVRFAIRD
jgi:VIT1/CCC1 family predicted Fe2+/Mn2+ transporter